MQVAEFPEFINLKTIQRVYGISPQALRVRKHRGKPMPFPLYEIQGFDGLAARYTEVKAYFDNLKPVTTTSA